jgi:hypothetical protein
MSYVSTQLLLAVGGRWEMAGIAASIFAAAFGLVTVVLGPFNRFAFPPRVRFDDWCKNDRDLPEYKRWEHARFCNRSAWWRRASKALRCEAFAEIVKEGVGRRDHPEPLVVARKPSAATEWSMRRGQCDMIPLLFENDLNIILGVDRDTGHPDRLTGPGIHLTDSHWIFGSSDRVPLSAGAYTIRVRLEYDDRSAFSPWREVVVPDKEAE